MSAGPRTAVPFRRSLQTKVMAGVFAGKLEYFDEYNDPAGPGYHREEWYVPARYQSPGRCYWSRSYQDPYTNEPMVTCTVAMRENDVFTGVSTVDLRLAGLQQFVAERGAALHGYAMVVDRNGVFITLPPAFGGQQQLARILHEPSAAAAEH